MILPHSLEAERAIIGAILVHGPCIHQCGALNRADFYHPTLGAIFFAAQCLVEQRRPIDLVTVVEQLRRSGDYGKLKASGGEALFAELMAGVITVENVSHWAAIVAEKADLRRLIEAGHEMVLLGERGDEDWRDQLRATVRALLAPRKRVLHEPAPIELSEVDPPAPVPTLTAIPGGKS